MKYIKRVILENFQSHKYSVIDFNEQLNVIVGPSDSGKSAVIRGIKWALYNEPAGDYFIREGEKECSVTLEFNDNTKLKRYRSKYKNSYILTNNEGEEIKFEGFGSTIPSEIIETIGIKKIYLDSEESNAINLGEQLEGPFLLSEKTATRASAIGRLVGVNIIDDALREVLKDNRNLNLQRKNTEETVLSLEKELEEFNYLDELKIRVEKIEKIKSRAIELKGILDKLTLLEVELDKIKNETLELNGVIKKLPDLNKLDQTIILIESNYLKFRQLARYDANMAKLKASMKESLYIVRELKDLQKVQATSERLDILYSKGQKLYTYHEKYKTLNTENKELTNTLNKLDKLPDMDKKIVTIDRNYKYLSNLENLQNNYKAIINSIDMGNKYLNKLSKIEVSDEKYRIIHLKREMLSKYKKLHKDFLTYNNEIVKTNNNITSINKVLDEELTNYENLLKKLEICPFCLSNINDDKINHIINHYIGG